MVGRTHTHTGKKKTKKPRPKMSRRESACGCGAHVEAGEEGLGLCRRHSAGDLRNARGVMLIQD